MSEKPDCQCKCQAKATGDMPQAQAVELAALTAYQDGAVVSRTLAKNAGGTITVFAFDAGQGLSEHTAPFDALVIGLEGTCRLTIGGADITCRPGQGVMMPANVPHAVAADERFKMLLVMLKSPA